MSVKDAIMDTLATDLEYCEKSDDETHCVHWWDCGPCCSCGDDPFEWNTECDCERHVKARADAAREGE